MSIAGPLRRFVPVALVLCCFTTVAGAGDFWELKAGDITVVAEGYKPAAAEAATMLVRIRHAARWVAQWPDDFRPMPVLAFALDDATIDRYFPRRNTDPDILPGQIGDLGKALHTPSVSILVFTVSRRYADKFAQLQYLYGQILMQAAPTANWPQCVRDGFSVAIMAGRLDEAGKLFLDGDSAAFQVSSEKQPLPPREFLTAVDAASMSETMRARRAFSCHALAMMSLHDEPLPRASFPKYLTLIGEGMDVGEAATTAFQIDEQQMQRLFGIFANDLRRRPATKKVRARLDEAPTAWPEPHPVTPERAMYILQQLAARMP